MTDVVVHLDYGIGKITVAGAPGELGAWKRGKVDLSKRNIGIEWFGGSHVSAHEIDRAAANFRIDTPPRIKGNSELMTIRSSPSDAGVARTLLKLVALY